MYLITSNQTKEIMARHRKKVKGNFYRKAVGVAAVLALTSLGTVATQSAFSDSATSSVTATAGSIELGLNAAAAKTFPIALGTALVPGGTVTRTVAIHNSGTLPMKYTASNTTATSGTLASTMNVVITSGGATLYTGKMNAISIPQRTLAANSNETLSMAFTWPNGTPAVDNPLMGTNANTVLTFNATN